MYGRIVVAALALGMAGCLTTGGAANWTCSAAGMISGGYSGGDYANIHLQGYSTGGSYRVKLNDQKTEAKGETKNGTPFTCIKQAG